MSHVGEHEDDRENDLRLLYANELQSYCCWADPTIREVGGLKVRKLSGTGISRPMPPLPE